MRILGTFCDLDDPDQSSALASRAASRAPALTRLRPGPVEGSHATDAHRCARRDLR